MDHLSLDDILGVIAPEATYDTVASSDPAPNWDGFWYANWRRGPHNVPPPTYEQVISAAQLMVAAGQNQTVESGLSGVVRLVDTVALQKVVAQAATHPELTVVGILALGAIFLYLHEPSDGAGMRARGAWDNFVQLAIALRAATGMEDADVAAFNAEIEALGFPVWLKIGVS